MDESLRLPPRLAAILQDSDPDPAETFRRLLDEIDPDGAERPRKSNDFPPRFA